MRGEVVHRFADTVDVAKRREGICERAEVVAVNRSQSEPHLGARTNPWPCASHVVQGPLHEPPRELLAEGSEGRPLGPPQQDDDSLSIREAELEELSREHVIACVGRDEPNVAGGAQRFDSRPREAPDLRDELARDDGREQRLLVLEVLVEVPDR